MVSLAPPWPGAVAVSGGGDSLALMLLLGRWAEIHDCAMPTVLSVDHGLHSDSRKQAQRVKALAAMKGFDAEILSWKGAKPTADVEAEARAARYALMGRWCTEHHISALYVAHTLEDQAETFLLRLSRGSGLDGLAGMRAISQIPVPAFSEVSLVRPLLQFSRNELRAYLTAQKQDWSEDPMNADPRFARVRLRQGWAGLSELGLTPQRVADAASHLARARSALDELIKVFLSRGVRFEGEMALLDPVRLKMLPRELGLRALAEVLVRISGQQYRPRFESLERLFDSILGGDLGGGATLHGCIVASAALAHQVFGSATLRVSRETSRNQTEPVPASRRKR